MQHAINAESHQPNIAARLQMDITGALFERIFEYPVHDINHMLLVGVQITILAKLNQLPKILHTNNLPALTRSGQADGISQVVYFWQIAIDFQRGSEHQLNFHVKHTL